jgi:hypothetical protein
MRIEHMGSGRGARGAGEAAARVANARSYSVSDEMAEFDFLTLARAPRPEPRVR